MSKSATFWLALCLFVAAMALDLVFGPKAKLPGLVNDEVRFEEVKPIFAERCTKCHRGGQDWTDYSVAKSRAASIKQRVWLFRNMPPKPAEMPEDERRLVKNWVDGGALE